MDVKFWVSDAKFWVSDVKRPVPNVKFYPNGRKILGFWHVFTGNETFWKTLILLFYIIKNKKVYLLKSYSH